MVSWQLKIVSQLDAFTISAARNIRVQYGFQKFVYLIVFVKDVFDIYLNNFNHIGRFFTLGSFMIRCTLIVYVA